MMTVTQAAERLSVSNRFIYRLCQQGLLEHFKLGNRIRITDEAITTYLEAQRKRPRQQLAEDTAQSSQPSLQFLTLRGR